MNVDKSISKIIMIGGGGHCRSVIDTVQESEKYSDIVITDPHFNVGALIDGCRIVGDDDILPQLLTEGFEYTYISVGSTTDTSIRRRIYESVSELGFLFPNITSLTSTISKNVQLKRGVYVGKHAVINSGCSIGDFAIINTGAIVEHDCKVGDFTHISISSVICGGCVIGSDTFVGANATIIQGKRVGNNCVVGAGSVVLADVPDGMTVYGVWKG